MASILHWLGYGLCHQLPERSFFAGGMQVPVCARDTGIYAGFMIAFALLAWVERGRRPTEPPRAAIGAILAVFIGLMLVDGVSSYAGWRTTSNELRLLTGLTTGYALAAFLVPILNSQMWRSAGGDRVLETSRSRIAFFVSLPAAYAALFYLAPAFGAIYPIAVGVSILVTFTAVNLAVVCLLPMFERRALHALDLWPAVLVALLLTIAELVASTYLKLWVEKLAGVR